MWCEDCQKNHMMTWSLDESGSSGVEAPGYIYTCAESGKPRVAQAEMPHLAVLRTGHEAFAEAHKSGECSCGSLTKMSMERVFEYGEKQWAPRPFRCRVAHEVPGTHELVRYFI